MIHKRYVASISTLASAGEDAIWQLILRQRQEVITWKNTVSYCSQAFKLEVSFAVFSGSCVFVTLWLYTFFLMKLIAKLFLI